MRAGEENLVSRFLADCVTEFLASHGMSSEVVDDLVESPPPSSHVELGSVLGFRGRSIRGGLAFVAPVGFIVELLPVPHGGSYGDAQLRDWTSEIANQLVGRLKNKLASRSVDFDVATPVCFSGKSIRLVFLPNANGLSLFFRTAACTIQVHVDLSVAVDIGRIEDTNMRVIAEGDVLLF